MSDRIPNARSFTIKVNLNLNVAHYRKIQHYKTMKGGFIQIKNMFTRKNNKLRRLGTDIDFKLLHIGCPIAHGLAIPYRTNGVFFLVKLLHSW